VSSAGHDSGLIDRRRAVGLFLAGMASWAELTAIDETRWAESNPDAWAFILYAVILATGIVAGLVAGHVVELFALPAGAALAIATGSLYFHGAEDVWRRDVVNSLIVVMLGTTVVEAITYGLRRWAGRTRAGGPDTRLPDYYTGTVFRADGLGNSVFSPNGVIGPGYLIDTPDRERRLRRFFRSYLLVNFAAMIALATLTAMLRSDLMALYALLAVFLGLDIGAYEIGVRRLVAGLPRSSAGRSSFRERLREQAIAFGRRRVAVLEAGSVVLVSLGLLVATTMPGARWIGLLTVAFFGFCGLLYAFELRMLGVTAPATSTPGLSGRTRIGLLAGMFLAVVAFVGVMVSIRGVPVAPAPLPSAALPSLATADEYHQVGVELRAQRKWEEAIAAFDKALELDPTFANAFSDRCNVLRSTRQFDRGVADCNRAIELDPSLVAAYLNRANLYDDHGDFELALADYNRAIELEPTVAVVHRNRGVAYKRHGDVELALADYNRAIELDPAYALAYVSRGGIERERGQFEAAAKDLDKAIELDPAQPIAYVNRGLLRSDQADIAGAVADFDKAIQLDPTYADAYARRAGALIDKGDYETAIADAQRAIELEPSLAEGYYSRGLANAYLGMDDVALSDYNRAIELEPNHMGAISARARVYMRQRNTEAALVDTERLVELKPDVAFLYAFRGAAKSLGGDTGGAAADFDLARSMATDPGEIKAIEDLRNELGL
jgi:tetratricopeptide (TPR) repeat protein